MNFNIKTNEKNLCQYQSPPFLNFLRSAKTNSAINITPKILSSNMIPPGFIVKLINFSINPRHSKGMRFKLSADGNWKNICALINKTYI